MMTRNAVLIDRGTGLYVGWYFWVRALDEVNRSARYGSPFGLLFLEAERPSTLSRKAFAEALGQVAAAVRATDVTGIISPVRVAVLLVQQEPEGAVLAQRSILERLSRLAPSVTWRSELLCYPRDGAEVFRLLADARAEGADQLAA